MKILNGIAFNRKPKGSAFYDVILQTGTSVKLAHQWQQDSATVVGLH